MLFSDPSAQNDLKMAQSDLALSQKLSKELQDYQSMVVEDYQSMVVARQASLILLPGQPALLRHVRRVLPAAGGSFLGVMTVSASIIPAQPEQASSYISYYER